LAVIVPTPIALAEYGNSPALTAALHESVQQTAVAAEAQSHEVPVDFLIETEPFTDQNGLLSGLGKQLRARLKEHYGGRLEQMYADIAVVVADEMRVLRQTAADRPVAETVARASRALIGTAGADRSPEAHFTDLGGDSLSALTFSNLLEEILVPAGVIISPANSLGELADYIHTQRSAGAQRPTSATIHGQGATSSSASELALDKFIDAQTFSNAKKLPHITGVPDAVLLTGASGWLVPFLLLAWATNGAIGRSVEKRGAVIGW
jgi:fatty acid CoA ligase FadD9